MQLGKDLARLSPLRPRPEPSPSPWIWAWAIVLNFGLACGLVRLAQPIGPLKAHSRPDLKLNLPGPPRDPVCFLMKNNKILIKNFLKNKNKNEQACPSSRPTPSLLSPLTQGPNSPGLRSRLNFFARGPARLGPNFGGSQRSSTWARPGQFYTPRVPLILDWIRIPWKPFKIEWADKIST